MKMTENNRMLKLIALAIAIVLWLYVGTQQDPLAQHTYEVQLEMENLPVDKTASLSEETVKVRVMGRQDRLNALSGSDFKASVDLSDVEEGEHALPVQVTLPNEVYFARTNPSMVNVQVDALQGSEMSVDINTTGTLPDGVTLEDMSVEPQKVFVTSDDTALLAEVDSVGVSVDLASVYDDSKQNVDVQFYDIAGNPINDERLQALPARSALPSGPARATPKKPCRSRPTSSVSCRRACRSRASASSLRQPPFPARQRSSLPSTASAPPPSISRRSVRPPPSASPWKATP